MRGSARPSSKRVCVSEQPGARCDLSRPEAAWLSYDGAEYAIVPDLRITSTASVAVSKGAIVYR
jgi:hypothetical protein